MNYQDFINAMNSAQTVEEVQATMQDFLEERGKVKGKVQESRSTLDALKIDHQGLLDLLETYDPANQPQPRQLAGQALMRILL